MTRNNSDKEPRMPRAFAVPQEEAAAPKAASRAQKAPDKGASQTKTRKPRVVKAPPVLELQPDEAAQRVATSISDVDAELTPPVMPSNKPGGFRLSRLVWVALGGLISMALGLWLDQLITDLFARQDWLGWLAVAFAGILVLGLFVFVVRELWGLRRLRQLDALREAGRKALETDDIKAARALLGDLSALYDGRADLARGRALLSEHQGEVVDGGDLVRLAERDLLKPLDQRARALVMGSAKRVSIVTAVSPRALVDVGFVLLENMRLIRQLAYLYGGRPGTLGFWRLARNVVGHLAVTGSIAVGDGLLQQVVGHGVASRLSSRLGEGVVNGLLTARIGIAAIDVCRPLPFSDQTRPTVGDFLSQLWTAAEKEQHSAKS
ncbi:MAG: TIGR01620 family protein [Pseudomonadota bacterium]